MSVLLAPLTAEAELTTKTVAAVAECPAFDPTRCEPLQALVNAGPAALDLLLESLRAEEQPVRRAASRVIARAEFGTAAERTKRLLASIEGTPSALRGETFNALGRIAHPSALATLVGVLGSDDNARNRIYAANAIGSFDADAARTSLVAGLNDATPRVQLAAAVNLGRIGNASSVPPLIRRALTELTAGFVREAAATALGRLKDLRGLAPLIILLGSEHTNVRIAAVRALAALKDRTAVPALLAMANDEPLADTLVEALASLGDPRGVGAVLKVANRTAATIPTRTRALWALGSIAAPETVGPIAAMLGDQSLEIVRAAAEALGRIKHKDATPHLMATLDHDDESVRRSAVWSLQQISGEKFALDVGAWKRWHESQTRPPKVPTGEAEDI